MPASILFVMPHAAFGGAERLAAAIIVHLKAAGHRPLVAIVTAQAGQPDAAPIWLEPHARLVRPNGPAALLDMIAAEDVAVMVICGLSPAYAMLPQIAGRHPALRIVAFQFNARECLAEHQRYEPYCDAIIAESVDVATVLSSAGVGMSVSVISSGVDAKGIAARPGLRRARHSPLESAGSKSGPAEGKCERLTVAYVGRFDSVKNPAAFLRLATRLDAEPLRFVMAGAGPRPWRVPGRRRWHICRRESRRGPENLPGRIEDRGLLDDRDLSDLLDGIDIIVVPSVIDGRPLIIQEAQARGAAVVATAVGGIPELVQHERTGLLVPPDDDEALAQAVRRLAGDPQLRARLGAASEARVRREGDIAFVLPLYEAVILGGAQSVARGG